MQDFTPRQIVEQLDRYIIGQAEAKRAVAVAVRNRWRRSQLDPKLAREVYPKNIIMAGPTGVGKTEIARRLARMTDAPFVKVEASKFTEVGYHGRDVESMVRDLVDQSISLVKREQAEVVRINAEEAAEQRLIDLLLPDSQPPPPESAALPDADPAEPPTPQQRQQRVRERLAQSLKAGKLDDKEVELTLSRRPASSVLFGTMGLDQIDPDMSSMFEKLIPEQNELKRIKVRDARQVLIDQETEKLLDTDKLAAEAIDRAERGGIIFLDEIDKIAVSGGSDGKSGGSGGNPDVSRQGVQRDLLPIVEGSQVSTRHGTVRTDHVLFIAAGAFHSAQVSDLMPELQGRFPIRVELSGLSKEDLTRILREPDNALTKQQQALLGVEGLEITFDDQAIEAIAQLAAEANGNVENIGARRLTTILERVFEEVNFNAPEMVASGETRMTVTESFVRERVEPLLQDRDLSRFVL